MTITATTAATIRLCGECRFDSRRNTVDRVGLFNHRRVVELGRRRIDMAARRNHEGHVLLAKRAGDRPHILALQIYIEDRKVEAALLNLFKGAFHSITGSLNPMPEGIEEILKHHRDQRLILHDEDRTRSFHRAFAYGADAN